MRLLAFLSFILISSIAAAQEIHAIEGVVLDNRSAEPMSYASVYNKTLQKGTITNSKGYFLIQVSDIDDSVFVSFVGYEEQQIMMHANQNFYSVYLEESAQILDEIIIKPRDPAYLYDLFTDCRKARQANSTKAKAYYELKSFIDTSQTELVEGYYNISINNYDFESLELKAGRLALQPFENRLFVSLESSRAISLLKFFDESDYFPQNPFVLSERKLKKFYDLKLDKKYIDQGIDSIYVINFIPLDSGGNYFNGTAWINNETKQLIKIHFESLSCNKHPFIPLFPTDSIVNINFEITKTFEQVDGKTFINHVDFNYVIDYKSRSGEEDAAHYQISTNAVLHAYDFDSLFFIPQFQFADPALSDYRKINAFPYNDFFWQNNNEYRMHESDQANAIFFSSPQSFTNKKIFSPNTYLKKGLLEHPYVAWSEKRVSLREIKQDSMPVFPQPGIVSRQYNLSVKIFMDLNYYNDSLNIFTATIFDPYETYYHLPTDPAALAFINIWFDLVEIERRKFQMQIEKENYSIAEIQVKYQLLINAIEAMQAAYFKSSLQGHNQTEMMKWNDIVVEKLGIDNLQIFNPYVKE